MKTTKIAIFASGNGSNAENIIRYCQANPACGVEVALVITNRADAGVIERASALSTPAKVMTRAEINDAATIGGVLSQWGIDAICLAGFLLMIPDFLLQRYAGRIINIHPSLLPKYGGKGMYGRHIHEAVVAAGERETGITIHHVSAECDGGEIIFQTAIPVASGATAAEVETAIHALERTHYPRIVAQCFGALNLDSKE